MRAIFIVSALNRSGTNFLSDIIQLDSGFVNVSNVNEDYLLRYSDNLIEYTEATVPHWSKWSSDYSKRDDAMVDLLQHFGDSLLTKLESKRQSDGVMVLKTPRPEGLENAGKLFPGQKVVVIDRDGRDVVDSFLRSFSGYTFYDAVRLWRDGVRQLDLALATLDEPQNDVKVLRIKYEDVLSGNAEAIEALTRFCGLNEDIVTPSRILALPLRGSSICRSGEEDVHWSPVAKPADYDPRFKWKNWSLYRREVFRWIAGRELAALGYS